MSEFEESTPASPLYIRAEGLEVLDGEAPWRDASTLPAKPDGFYYGVRYKNHPVHNDGDHPLGSERELLNEISQRDSRVDLVYLPDQERAIPLRSLSVFQALDKKDFRRHFFKMLRSQGLFGFLAIVAAVYLNSPDFSGMLILFGIIFGIIPAFDALIQWLMYPGSKSPQELKKSIVHGAVFNRWISQGKLSKWCLWAPILIFVIVFIGQLTAAPDYDTVTERGIIVPKLIASGEWWRLFTATLMHADIAVILHIGMNSLAFVYLGKFVLRLTHPLMVPIIFVASAFVGALASNAFLPEAMRGSLGASGGVVGLIGFLAWLMIVRRGSFPYEFRSQMLRNIILLLVLGFLGFFFVDNAGHAGGFVGGVVCGVIYDVLHRNRWEVPTTPVLATLGALSFAVLIFGMLTCLDLFYFEGNLLVRTLLQ